MARVLLITPPMTQLNTPYPATAYLTGFLRSRGVDTRQADASLDLFLKLASRAGLTEIAATVAKLGSSRKRPASIGNFLANRNVYLSTVNAVVAFLQGRDPSLALRIVSRSFLPEGPRFASLAETADAQGGLGWAFGALGVQDQAKYLASLYIDDLVDVIREGIDPRFELSRYGEKLAASAPSFDPLQKALEGRPTLVDRFLDEIMDELLSEHDPDVIAWSVPFPGNVYGAFRMARRAREKNPRAKRILGGGYVNTELRELAEPRVFEYFDYVTLDDGERPLLCLLEYFDGKKSENELFRTFRRKPGLKGPKSSKVEFVSDARNKDVPQKDLGTPTYAGLKLSSYLSIFEMLNPMHRIWSDGRWNKLTLAHGCYWKKCAFCDVTLDYIGRYEPAQADLVVDRIEALIAETGQRGFHFVDEAAPPALLRAVAERLIERGVVISWWGNVRFEKVFTPELASLLGRSGCVAVSGGLEVASDRLLKLMNKGVTVEQVARVTRALTDAGIMVHAYLMYGFPTQTEQETVDALERVRQLFAEGCIQSAYWHRFSATVHSPIGKSPENYGIRIRPVPTSFARNDLDFEDPTGTDHDMLGVGLRRAVYNFMHGVGLEQDVARWFPEQVPQAQVARDLITRAHQAM